MRENLETKRSSSNTNGRHFCFFYLENILGARQNQKYNIKAVCLYTIKQLNRQWRDDERQRKMNRKKGTA